MVELTPELEQKILEQLAKKPWQVRDLAKILKIKKKELDQIIQKLINEGKAAYWSSGSTTYVTTPEKLEEMEKKRAEG